MKTINITEVEKILPFVPFIVKQDTEYRNEFMKRNPQIGEREFWEQSLQSGDYSFLNMNDYKIVKIVND